MRHGAKGASWLVAAIVLFAGCASDTADSLVVTTASGPAPTRLPDLAGQEELEAALVSFGECVEESFPIAIRFRTDVFIGVEYSVGSQTEAESDEVDAVTTACDRQLDLDRRLSAYQGEHDVSQTERDMLVSEFVACVEAVSAEVAERVSEANLQTLDDVMRYTSALHPLNSGLTGQELSGISECQSEITGPEMVFGDGHPWFTP